MNIKLPAEFEAPPDAEFEILVKVRKTKSADSVEIIEVEGIPVGDTPVKEEEAPASEEEGFVDATEKGIGGMTEGY